MQSINSIIWSTYIGGVLIAWIVLLLVIPDSLDDPGLWFAAALPLGFPLSILLMFIYPYLSPHLEAWIERDIERIENSGAPSSSGEQDEPRDRKGKPPRPAASGIACRTSCPRFDRRVKRPVNAPETPPLAVIVIEVFRTAHARISTCSR